MLNFRPVVSVFMLTYNQKVLNKNPLLLTHLLKYVFLCINIYFILYTLKHIFLIFKATVTNTLQKSV